MRARFCVLGFLAAAGAAAWLDGATAAEDPTAEQIADIVDDLRDRDEHVRAMARKALLALGEKAVPQLVALVTTGPEASRAEAVMVLAAMGPAAHRAAPAIAERVQSTSGPARLPLLRALAEIDPAGSARTAVPIILSFIEDRDASVRLEAALALRAFGPTAAAFASEVLRLVPRADPPLRSALLEALRAMGVDAASYVVDVHAREGAGGSTAWLQGVVAELGEAVVPAAVQRLSSEDKNVRAAAAEVLGLAGPAARGAAPSLVQALGDPAGLVRRRAADALGAIGADPKTAVAPLVRLLEDASARAQVEAARALGAVAVRAAGPLSESAPQPAATARAIADALDWFARHGAGKEGAPWAAAGYVAQCQGGTPCTGQGEVTYDLGVSALATLAFLGAGETHQQGSHRDVVQRALQYIRTSQDTDGVFGSRTSQHWIYQHAICTLAAAEAWRMTQAKFLEEPVRRGVDVLRRIQNPYLAWRYDFPPNGDNDTSVTSWAVRALGAGRRAGVPVERSVFANARTWVDKMTEPEHGRTGYQQRGGPPARTSEMLARFPADKSESMTAAGLCVRAEAGDDLEADPIARKSVALLLAKPPRREDPAAVDFYYWFQGTDALRRVRGAAWENWRDSLLGTLLAMQETARAGCARGSWAPVDPWGPSGGRVYATALATLSLEMSGGVERKAPLTAEVRDAVAALTRVAATEDEAIRAAAQSALAEIRAVYK